MHSINIVGKSNGQDFPHPQAGTVPIRCQQEIVLANQRSQSAVLQLELDGDVLLELVFSNGSKRWLRVAELIAELQAQSPQRGGTVLLSEASFATGTQRGGAEFILKVLRVLAFDPVQKASDLLAAHLVQRLESERIGQPGLFRCANTDKLCLEALESPVDIDASQPVLLFIHGTFSSTEGSFGDLWESRQAYNAPAWLQRLFQPFAEQVLALEHHTLTVSPIENALQVVEQLPAYTRLHIVSHSRGGLVGELLCQGSLLRLQQTADGQSSYQASETVFTDEELQHFADDSQRQHDFAGLQALAQALQDKQIRVERFVRVACPSRGTVLASSRLEEGLSVAFNVLQFIPSERLQRLANFIQQVLFSLANKRTQAHELPGLEAMMPTSPLVRLLNRPGIRLDSELSIIAGKVQTAGGLGSVQSWIMQHFFGEDNDYVVDTAGMSGGAERLNGQTQFYLDDDSNHFGYFRDGQVRKQLLNSLHAPAAPRDASAFVEKPPLAFGEGELQPSSQSTVIFLPGFMGSHLYHKDKPVWLDMGALGWGDFTRLRMEKADITAQGILQDAYQPLLSYLQQAHQLIPLAYDWRLSCQQVAMELGLRLGECLDAAQLANQRPVLRVLAHSTGGLAILALQQQLPELWQRLCTQADFRCVLLGTPLQGTWRSVQLLLGQHRLLNLLNLLDGQLDEREAGVLSDLFASYPAVVELLPDVMLTEDRWQKLLGEERFARWPARTLLAQARSMRQQLQQLELDTKRLLYVHGRAHLTPWAVEQTLEGWQLSALPAGDGVTLWETIDSRLPAWYMPVEHGYMASYPHYFAALQYLLDDGFTHQLSQQAPALEHSEPQWLAPLHRELFPNAQELQAAALGYHTQMPHEEVRPKIRVQVIHGNLRHVRHPVAVGHYVGDAILSAEAALDRCMAGKLSERQRMGLYPGALNTSYVYLRNAAKPAGAIVVGLGEVGKLSAGRLAASFMRAMLDYAHQVREVLQNSADAETSLPADEIVPVNVASLLIGTVGGGSVGLADSLAAILRALIQANLALAKLESAPRLRLQQIEFIELYEDRAVEAARLLQDLLQLPEFRHDFQLSSLMRCLPGQRRRVMYNDPPGWWRRIQIEAGAEAGQYGLKYTTLTDKARAELMLQSTQRKLVDQFIHKAVSNSHNDPEVGKVLFELLVPAALKEQAPNAENLVLVLDSEASAYPWELLYNRFDQESQPLAVRFGVLRQLHVGQYRQQVFSALERSALVVGDPPVGGQFVQLPAAREEARHVANLLEAKGFSHVRREIGTDSQAVLTALHSGDYRVLHLAGHGVYRHRPDPNSEVEFTGMVLEDGIFLTPVEIQQMRKVPELAFINCCHLARMDFMDESTQAALSQDRTRLAASLAQELIRMGVRAVIAAGWAIDDNAAKVFANTCYHALLQGYPFGKAVLMARQATWHHDPNGNTWGAYQCYGDPDYCLLSRTPEQNSHDEQQAAQWGFVAEAEVLAELDNLINATDSAHEDEFHGLEQQVRQLQGAIPAEWLANADIQYALGRAFGKLECFAEAIAAYNSALNAPQANYPVLLLEDKVSLQTAWAVAWFFQQAKPADVDLANSPAELMNDSQRLLNLLAGLGTSLQRLEETGKFWKRQAMMVDGSQRVDALAAMERHYQQAHEFALQQRGKVAAYPLINWLSCRVVRYLRGDSPVLDRQDIQYWLQQGIACADEVDRKETTFCSGITRAECHLLHYVLGARLNENSHLQQTVEYYKLALSRGGAPRQQRFVNEHLTFMQQMLAKLKDDQPQLNALIAALTEIEKLRK